MEFEEETYHTLMTEKTAFYVFPWNVYLKFLLLIFSFQLLFSIFVWFCTQLKFTKIETENKVNYGKKGFSSKHGGKEQYCKVVFMEREIFMEKYFIIFLNSNFNIYRFSNTHLWTLNFKICFKIVFF